VVVTILVVEGESSISVGARPYFLQEPTYQTVQVSAVTPYTLPSHSCENSCELEFELGAAALFTTVSEEELFFEPTDPKLMGNYTILVRLTDTTTLLTKDYSFEVEVTPEVVLVQNSAEPLPEVEPQEVVEEVSEHIVEEPNEPFSGINVVQSNATGEPLLAMIKEVSMKGVMTVTFSEDIYIPQNYSDFSQKHLLVELLTDTQGAAISSWTITEFEESQVLFSL